MDKHLHIATLTDAPKLSELVNLSYRGEFSKQGWTTEADLLDGIRMDEERIREMILKPNSKILKYESGPENIIACIHLEKTGGELYVGMVTVYPTRQGKGIGKILLKAAEEEAALQECPALSMTVLSNRTELIAWYIRHGYRDSGERKDFFTDVRFGIPKMPLQFAVLRKKLCPSDH